MISKFKYVLLLFFLTQFSNGQEKILNASDFDDAYLHEIKLENTTLSSRIKTFPPQIQDINKQIGQAIREKNDSKALELVIEADKIYPNNPDIKNFKGKMQAKILDFDAALISFDEAINLNPNNKWFYINKASVLADKEQFLEALQTIEKLNTVVPNWSISYNVKASLFLELNQQKEALKAYETALNLEPKSAQIYTNRGDLYLKLSKEDEAISDFKKALEIQPDYSRALEKLKLISQKK